MSSSSKSSSSTLPPANWWEKTFDPNITAALNQIAKETGQEVNFLKALALAVNLGVQSGSGTSQPVPTGKTTSRTLQSIETEWFVGSVHGHTISGLPEVTIVDANGKPVQIAASQVATYTGVLAMLPNAGVRTTIQSIAEQGGATIVTLADPVNVSAGQPLIVYVRPIKVESSGAASVQGTQIYTGTTAASMPALSTAKQTISVSFRPSGLGVEVHRGQAYLVSAQGYAYTVQVQHFLEQIDPDGSVVDTAQSAVLSMEAATPSGWLPWGVDPPAVSTLIKFTITPNAAETQADTLTIRWFVDANDTAVDQNPDATTGPPIYVGGVDQSGKLRTVKVDSEGRLVTTASGSSYLGTAGSGSTTTAVVDSVGGWQPNQWDDYGIQFTDDTTTKALQGVWQKITSNTATTLTLAAALPAAPVSGDTYNIRVFGSSVMDVQSIGGESVPGSPIGTSGSIVPSYLTQVGGEDPSGNLHSLATDSSGRQIVSTGPATADTIPVDTAAAATTPLLETYGTTKAHYTAPANGTMTIGIALNTATTLSMSHNASATSPSYNALNSGQNLAANAEYALSIPVQKGEILDFEVGAAVTINYGAVSFTATL